MGTVVTVVGSENSRVSWRGDRHHMDTTRSLMESRGRAFSRMASPGGSSTLLCLKLKRMGGSPFYLICICRKALDCFNWRDLNTAQNHSPLNWFLVLGPFSASWPCDDNRGGSLQERTHCSANMSTIHLPDPPVFSQRNLSILTSMTLWEKKGNYKPFRIH